MEREKLSNVDKLQNSEEIGFQSRSNETVYCNGMTTVGTVDVPLNLLPKEDMSSAGLTGLNCNGMTTVGTVDVPLNLVPKGDMSSAGLDCNGMTTVGTVDVPLNLLPKGDMSSAGLDCNGMTTVGTVDVPLNLLPKGDMSSAGLDCNGMTTVGTVDVPLNLLPKGDMSSAGLTGLDCNGMTTVGTVDVPLNLVPKGDMSSAGLDCNGMTTVGTVDVPLNLLPKGDMSSAGLDCNGMTTVGTVDVPLSAGLDCNGMTTVGTVDVPLNLLPKGDMSSAGLDCNGMTTVGTVDVPLNLLPKGDMSSAGLDCNGMTTVGTVDVPLNLLSKGDMSSVGLTGLDCNGMTTVETVDVSLNLLSMGDMSSAVLDCMTDASHVDSYPNFMVGPHLLNRMDHMLFQYLPLKNMNANSGGLQTATQGIKRDESRPQSIGNSIGYGNRVVQSNYPEPLDGSFLTLGVGVNTETRSKYREGDPNTQLGLSLNTSHSQSDYGSSFSDGLKMAANLPDLQSYTGGLSSMKENVVESSSFKHNFGGHSGSSNVTTFPGSTQSVATVVGLPNRMQNASPQQLFQDPQSHVPSPSLKQGHQEFGAGFTNIVSNHGISSPSLNGEHPRSHSGLHPNLNVRTLSGTSPLPVQEQQRFAPIPLLSSLMTSKYATVTPDQLQKHDMGSIPSLQRGTSMASVFGNIESTNNQSDYPIHRDAAIQNLENAPSSMRIQHQLAGKDKLPAADGNVAEGVSILQSSNNNAGFQAATYPGQFQNNTLVQASNNLVPAHDTPGPVIPLAVGNVPAITSDRLSRSTLKRKAAQPPTTTPPVRRKRTRRPSPRSSTLGKAQNALHISHVPFVAYPASARTGQYPHIKRQDDRDPLQPSGYICFLCKRDLSYEPDGPITQTVATLPVAVLSCGHCFHDLCLERIMTPDDEASNPPCIPCAIGEMEE